MIRFSYFISVLIAVLALVGGSMMAAIAMLLFVGSNLFPNVADISATELMAFAVGGGIFSVIGWISLALLTSARLTGLIANEDSVTRKFSL